MARSCGRRAPRDQREPKCPTLLLADPQYVPTKWENRSPALCPDHALARASRQRGSPTSHTQTSQIVDAQRDLCAATLESGQHRSPTSKFPCRDSRTDHPCSAVRREPRLLNGDPASTSVVLASGTNNVPDSKCRSTLGTSCRQGQHREIAVRIPVGHGRPDSGSSDRRGLRLGQTQT